MTEKKLQVISTYFYPVTAGSEINLLNSCSNLVRRGWEVTIYTTKDSPHQKNIYKSFEDIKRIKVRRFSYLSFGFLPFSMSIDYRKSGIINLDDFITFPDFFICTYTLVLKVLRLKKFTLIFTAHGLFNYDTSIYPGFKFRVKQAIDHSLGVFLINRAVDGIRAVSETEKNGLINAGINSDLIRVIRNGIEDEAFLSNIDELASTETKRKIESIPTYIVQVARINPIKNFETTIRAMQNVREDVKFVIVGQSHDEEYKKALLSLVKKLNLENRVIFLGEVSVIDKYFLLKNSKAFVHMSKSEGFGIALLEAMSQGCVCVISRGTAMDELVQNSKNGFSLDFDDYQGVAKKIEYILDEKNADEISKMKKYNLEFVSDFSWDKITDLIEDFYLRMANRV